MFAVSGEERTRQDDEDVWEEFAKQKLLVESLSKCVFPVEKERFVRCELEGKSSDASPVFKM